jgi:hypothetical protein
LARDSQNASAMSLQNTSGEAHVELRTMPDSLGHDEESPLNSSENSAGSDAANEGDGGGESSVASASFNFINTIVGAGVIGIPYSIYQAGALYPDSTKGIRLTLPLQCGFFAGIILLIAFGVATDYSVRLLIDLGVTYVFSLFVLPFQLNTYCSCGIVSARTAIFARRCAPPRDIHIAGVICGRLLAFGDSI